MKLPSLIIAIWNRFINFWRYLFGRPTELVEPVEPAKPEKTQKIQTNPKVEKVKRKLEF
jgi:hypothetical protein